MLLLGLFLTSAIYLTFSTIGILLFRGTLHPSVLQNFGDIKTPEGTAFFESQVIQTSFIVVLLCHVPFIFYAGKEAICIIVDEFQRQSISKALAMQANAREWAQTHEFIESEAAVKSSYKDMDDKTYYFVTILLYSLEVALSIVVSDITVLFSFASAVAVTFICFWYPGVYYLLASERFAKKQSHACKAYLLIALGFVNFALGIYAAFLTIKK